MKRKARFAEGIDVWTCDCGRVNIMGRTCACGRTNADKLAGEVRELPKRERRKPFNPVMCSDSGLLESYLKRKDAKKMKQYGVPYKWSKNKIARQLIDILPAGEVFVDLFAGGCAMTHAAAVSGKYKKVIANDLDQMPFGLFRRAINGEYKNETRWISREDFQRLKDTDPYVRFCWSFGNKGDCYLYAKEIEPWKKALHYARVLGDTSLLREFGIISDGSRKDILVHAEENKIKYIKWYRQHIASENNIHLAHPEELESLQRLQRLQRLQGLERLESLQRLQISGLDYREVPIPSGAVVYADPPYLGTESYNYKKFDSSSFWQWVRSRDFTVYVSEYNAPDDFVSIVEIEKSVTICSGGSKKAIEKLFVHRRFFGENSMFADLPLFAWRTA